jgi:hypothetical protein
MKLRMHGNSVRLRLNQAEVAQFSKTGFFEDAIEFGPGMRFTYAIEASSAIERLQAIYKDGSLRIQVPHAVSLDWATSDQVGLSGGEHPAITIEKDFQCLHREGPQDPHAYPNPESFTPNR